MCAFCTWKCFLKLFSNYSLALNFFGERILAQNLIIKCWWNWLQGSISTTFDMQFMHSCRYQKHKKTLMTSLSFCTFWIYSSIKHVGEIDYSSPSTFLHFSLSVQFLLNFFLNIFNSSFSKILFSLSISQTL